MIIVLDNNLTIVHANQKLLTNIRQLLGLNVEVGGKLTQYIKNEVIKLLYYSVKELTGNIPYQQLPLQIPVLNGKYICSIEPVPDASGKMQQTIITFTDTDWQAEVQGNRPLTRPTKRAISATSSYNKLLELFTHDLNGSMNSIKMMSSDEFESQEHLDFIPRIYQLTCYCNAIINGADLLMKYNPQAAGIEIINIYNAITRIAEKYPDYASAMEYSGIDPTHEIYSVQPYIRCVLENLIDNAIKFRSPERKLQIKVTSQKTDQWQIVTVKDNGLGIDLSKYGHLLNKPFKKIEDKENYGTGLYLVHSIMEVIEGNVKIESTKGQGTTVSLFFKVEQ